MLSCRVFTPVLADAGQQTTGFAFGEKNDFQAGEFSKHNYAKIYSAVAIKAPGYVKSSLTAGRLNGAG